MNLRLLALILLIIAYYYLVNHFIGYACPSAVLTGFPCPGCGLTRAALLMLKGDFTESLRMNPMLLFIPAYIILAVCKKKRAADIYLICIIILSFIVFGWRMFHSFGTEPLVYNPNNVISFLLRNLS